MKLDVTFLKQATLPYKTGLSTTSGAGIAACSFPTTPCGVLYTVFNNPGRDGMTS